jgi:hypothetical protein
VVKNHSLIAFFVLAFAFSWPMWLLTGLYPDSAAYIPSPTFGPLIAAVVVLALTRGRSGVKELLSRMGGSGSGGALWRYSCPLLSSSSRCIRTSCSVPQRPRRPS